MTTPTPYTVIYDRFLSKVTDFDLVQLTETEVYDIAATYLPAAVAEFQDCKQDLTDVDKVKEEFNNELTDLEIEILANFMAIEYLLSKYVRTQALLKYTLFSKDFDTYSPSNLLDRASSMVDALESRNRRTIAMYSYDGTVEGLFINS